MSVDGTDFLINEPKPFDNCWFSHKFRGPGLRYEVEVSIEPLKIFGRTDLRPVVPIAMFEYFVKD